MATKRLSDEEAAAREAGDGITTRLPGGYGVPPIFVRDHDAWRAQVADERRRLLDEQIAGTVAGIRQADEERRQAPPADLAGLEDSMRANAALHRERMEAPARIARELAQTEALLAGMIAAEPPPPDPEAARRAQANDYSFGLAETMQRLRAGG